MTIKILEVERHRNGIGGEPFYAVTFIDPKQDGAFVATIFGGGPNGDVFAEGDGDGNFVMPRVAVLNTGMLPSVEFGVNSWRGDEYAPALFDAIREYEANLSAILTDGSAV